VEALDRAFGSPEKDRGTTEEGLEQNRRNTIGASRRAGRHGDNTSETDAATVEALDRAFGSHEKSETPHPSTPHSQPQPSTNETLEEEKVIKVQGSNLGNGCGDSRAVGPGVRIPREVRDALRVPRVDEQQLLLEGWGLGQTHPSVNTGFELGV